MTFLGSTQIQAWSPPLRSTRPIVHRSSPTTRQSRRSSRRGPVAPNRLEAIGASILVAPTGTPGLRQPATEPRQVTCGRHSFSNLAAAWKDTRRAPQGRHRPDRFSASGMPPASGVGSRYRVRPARPSFESRAVYGFPRGRAPRPLPRPAHKTGRTDTRLRIVRPALSHDAGVTT